MSQRKKVVITVLSYFPKAFDSIPQSLMFYRLLQDGVHGEILTVLKSLYSNLK